MYPQYFSLNGPLFAHGIAQDDAMFIGDEQRAAVEHMRIGLSSADSAIVLLGTPGVGKTTLAASALRTSSAGTRIACGWLGTAPATAHDLLELLLSEFGFDPYKLSRVERLQTWRQFLTEVGATGTRAFIALERAHDVDAAVLAALDSLTKPDPNGCPGANLILMGDEPLVERLEHPSLVALRQRVRLVKRVAALDAACVEAYLRHAAREAGGDYDRLFARDALPALTSFSGGIPRVLNHLCDTALSLAASRAEPHVTGAIVRYAATEICGLAAPAAEADVDADDADAPCAPLEPVAAAQAEDSIPVLTESVDIVEAIAFAMDEADLDLLDGEGTLALLEDADLDDLSPELAAAILSADGAEWSDPFEGNGERAPATAGVRAIG